MGVLAGRFPGKAREGHGERMLNRLVELVKKFIRFAEGYGVAIAEREVEARLDREKKAFYF